MNTRDFVKVVTDASRRDLTINAMAMDFDGNIIDPYMGFYDLAAKRVRFVGNAEERMREDYLRILRFFRFHARFAGSSPIDEEAKAAIIKVAAGLKQISVERIWQEMSKIISGPAAEFVLGEMVAYFVWDMEFPCFVHVLAEARSRGITNPASLIAFICQAKTSDIAIKWKFSTEERNRAEFIIKNIRVLQNWYSSADMARLKELLVDGAPFDWVADLMRWSNIDVSLLENWVIPVMPVTGRDLIAVGVTPGPAMGDILDKIRKEWIKSDYQMNKEQLMKHFALCS